MNEKLSDENIFSMLKKEYVKVPDGLDKQVLSKLNSKKANLFTKRLKVYSVAATITIAIIISLRILNVNSPMNTTHTTNNSLYTKQAINYDIFNDEELLLAYDELYSNNSADEYDISDDEDFYYEDELYEDIAFLENM